VIAERCHSTGKTKDETRIAISVYHLPRMDRRLVQRLTGLLFKRLDFKSDGVIFTRNNLTRTQIVNLLLAHLEARLRVRRPLCYPVGIQLEPTFACQLDCPLCPRQLVKDGVAGGPMPWEDYEKLMKQIGPYLLAIAFWRFGEPLLHPHLTEMVAMAHRYNILTLVSTNGQFNRDAADLRGLFEAGLDHLIISTDGATQETYSHFRRGSSLERLKAFTEAAVSAKRSLRLPNPVINVRAIATRRNEPEVDDIISFARAVGADVFTLKSLYLCQDGSPSHPELPLNYKLRSLQYRGEDGAETYRRLPNLCRKPWTWPTVCHDGTLLVCECDDEQERVLGNVFTSNSFRSVWRGRPAQDFRDRFPVRGTIGARFCQRCRYKLDDNMLMLEPLR